MKLLYLFFILFLFSCSNLEKKSYICGDRLCIDKKEYNEYFAKNLIIEVSKSKKKKKKINLVELNTNRSIENKKLNNDFRLREKVRKKSEKERLIAEKIRLLEERKIKEREAKFKAEEEKQLAKASKSNQKKKNKTIYKKKKNQNIVKNTIKKKDFGKNDNKNIPTNKEIQIDSVKSENIKGICDEIQNCDIDKIAEILTKKGKSKPYPSISSN